MEKKELRKQKEAEFHDKIRNENLRTDIKKYEYLTSNKKFYSISRESKNFVINWLLEQKEGKKILDYCCGNGDFSILLAKNGANVTGIDISGTSIQNAKNAASKEGPSAKVAFFVMDAEKTSFSDNYFDLIVCLGVLHHLNTSSAFKELSRILKPDGKIICDEPLVYNPIFQLYRKITPHLRTNWEADHVLSKRDLNISRQYFNKIETRFFHLFVLGAVPFRNLPVFNPLLKMLEKIDSAVLKLPFLKWLSWQIIFILSKPNKLENEN